MRPLPILKLIILAGALTALLAVLASCRFTPLPETPAPQVAVTPTTAQSGVSPSPAPADTLTSVPQNLPLATPLLATPLLATPYSLEPAAGICAGPVEGDTITVEINPDVPSPRCVKALPDQKLNVVNRTGEAIRVRLGSAEYTLQRGAESTLDVRLGDVLAPGVHILAVEPYFGPEIWLIES